MSNLFQGANCGPNGMATGNQYKRLMNTFVMGNNNPERIMQMNSQGKNFEGDIKSREMAFQAMNQGWGEASTFSAM